MDNIGKIIAIVGPTASGKSSLGVKLAREFGGEIISADSRQVYGGLDVGSGKITKQEMEGVPHHLLDVADPARSEPFTLAEYLRLARVKIDEIASRGNIPFVVGGTGLYVSALLEGYEPPEVPPNPSLRQELNKKTLAELQNTYKKLDPEGFAKIDIKNPRRLVRAIEVVKATGRPFFKQQHKNIPTFSRMSECLMLGVKMPFDELKQRIHKRLHARYPAMFNEVIDLHKKGVSWERLDSFGLEYRWMRKLADKKRKAKPLAVDSTKMGDLTDVEREILQSLERDIVAYARRQLTWWRKRNVVWIKSYSEAKKEVGKFLK